MHFYFNIKKEEADDYDEKDAFTCVYVGLPTALIDKYKPFTTEEG